ncbi:MAG: HigA family addiction module antidote protein [Treponema sp.]|jgi:addiction module HigA family antidote|nr:HigA family addiction module antidote protein [Treponema sp.]
MQKNIQTPGTALKALLGKHGLNCNRLSKAINMSNAMVRLLVLDKSPVSITAAFRLAKFFKTKPEYWLILQMNYDLSKAEKDKVLAKEISGITDVGNYQFVRKPHASKAVKKIVKKKITLADKRKAAAKIPGAKQARGKKISK